MRVRTDRPAGPVSPPALRMREGGAETAWCTGLGGLRNALVAARAQGSVPSGLRLEVTVPAARPMAEVIGNLRVWLPVVRALGVNSPFQDGRDTGYAGWSFVRQQRESLGALGPRLPVATDHAYVAERVRRAGAVMSQALLDWQVRPHPVLPVVQVKAGDPGFEVDDSLLVAALVRATVATAPGPGPQPEERAVQDAHWQAARSGLGGMLLDPRLRRSRPAWDLVDEFVATVTPALAAGPDREVVRDGLARLHEQGTGADRQRRTRSG